MATDLPIDLQRAILTSQTDDRGDQSEVRAEQDLVLRASTISRRWHEAADGLIGRQLEITSALSLQRVAHRLEVAPDGWIIARRLRTLIVTCQPNPISGTATRRHLSQIITLATNLRSLHLSSSWLLSSTSAISPTCRRIAFSSGGGASVRLADVVTPMPTALKALDLGMMSRDVDLEQALAVGRLASLEELALSFEYVLPTTRLQTMEGLGLNADSLVTLRLKSIGVRDVLAGLEVIGEPDVERTNFPMLRRLELLDHGSDDSEVATLKAICDRRGITLVA